MSNITKIIICAIFLYGCISPEKLERRTEEQKSDLLKKANGQVSEVLSVKGAKFTLLHIQQQHYSDIATERCIEKMDKEKSNIKIRNIKAQYLKQIQDINQVQKEIYEFLLHMSTEKDFLYVEGRSFPHHYRDRFLAEYKAKTFEGVNKVFSYKEAFPYTIPEPAYFMGASIPIHEDRRMNVVGAENLSLLNLTLSLYENRRLHRSDLYKFIMECHEAREDQMIKNMAKNFDELPHLMNSIRFLICGSKHDFKKNIEEWNKNNPEQKFNLLVYKPSSIR